ncbi:T9SS type A sorting domain-containing protein [Flavitalea sp. BT771]|uniref:T9SS type A sorting domain-containing protein n=1 Tax=Flavitalea sp. BT771 TaxID=3063329 RepID=UPI0026E447A1|nr:T9SS type A sorting domain-containing protein [Flavitalea sp. BT771]MDO6434334.1 T9SS type A sorting domain-containing protein [Flavitalea sp. BT771]MDV6223234.1 T9SS type A sorting domain-containing protein [Flavitalea sp. BT771]
MGIPVRLRMRVPHRSPGLLIWLSLLLAPGILSAQNTKLIIQGGTTFSVTGNNLVLNKTDLKCDGALDASNATVLLMGSSNTSMGGTGSPLIKALTLNTSAASTLTLNTSLQISNALNFENGLIDLNNHQLQLAGNGALQGESEASHITGVTGGAVTVSATGVNNPNQLNAGNLGAVLTSGANLGNLTVSRSSKPATNPGNGSIHGIQRTFLIQPQNNTALNATLRFYYLNAELNGDDPSTLSLWKSSNGVNWIQMGADSRNAAGKYVEKTGLTDLSYWTLTDLVNPLPLVLLSFKASCEDSYTQIQWQTGVEADVDHFEIERSTDAVAWTTLGKLAATNNPSGAAYSYKDPDRKSSVFYRLKIIDRSGSYGYSPVFEGGCSDITLPFSVYPNPVQSEAVAQVAVREASRATIRLFSISGQLLLGASWDLQPGINHYVLPVSQLAAGTYVVEVRMNNVSLQTKITKQ